MGDLVRLSDFLPCLFLRSEPFLRLRAPGRQSDGDFGEGLDHSWAPASVCSSHANRTTVGELSVTFSAPSDGCQRDCIESPGAAIARGVGVGGAFWSHTPLNPRPLCLSTLQRHREQAGVQQERGRLLGTTGVRQLSGTRSGSPHSLPQPEREIGHSSDQPTGHPLHPAVPQVRSKQRDKTLRLPALRSHARPPRSFTALAFTFARGRADGGGMKAVSRCFFFQAQRLLVGGIQQLDFYDHALMG